MKKWLWPFATVNLPLVTTNCDGLQLQRCKWCYGHHLPQWTWWPSMAVGWYCRTCWSRQGGREKMRPWSRQGGREQMQPCVTCSRWRSWYVRQRWPYKVIYSPLINAVTSGHNKLWWPPVANILSVTFKCCASEVKIGFQPPGCLFLSSQSSLVEV